MKTIIVIDTSVFVSAILSPSGGSREVIRRALQKKYSPLMGTALYNEYESLITREVLFENSIISLQERTDLLDAFLSVCEWTSVYYLWRPNLIDEADNHLIELAVAGSAEVIVTHNIKHLKNGELSFPQIKVLKPNELLGEASWQR